VSVPALVWVLVLVWVRAPVSVLALVLALALALLAAPVPALALASLAAPVSVLALAPVAALALVSLTARALLEVPALPVLGPRRSEPGLRGKAAGGRLPARSCQLNGKNQLPSHGWFGNGHQDSSAGRDPSHPVLW
jgi:hypothetical protein